MNVHRMLGGLALATAVCTACGGGGAGGDSPTSPSDYNGSGTPTSPAAPGTNQVIATSTSVFTPAALTVATGTTVTFTFESVTHNVTFDSKAGAPSNIGDTYGASATRTFAAAGSFPYQCTIHSGMRGTVTVN